MKTRERTQPEAEEPRWYESAARPSVPGGLTKAEAADPTRAEPAQDAGAGVNRRKKLRWLAGVYAVVAAVWLIAGREFDATFWAALAFLFAIEGESRRRVPKLLRYFAVAAAFQHIGILSLEFHVDKLSRPLL